jgi:hypothetical protein
MRDCVHMHVCVHACMHVCACAHSCVTVCVLNRYLMLHAWFCACMLDCVRLCARAICVHTRACVIVCVHAGACAWVLVHVRMHECVCTCVIVCTCMCVRMCMHVCACMHAWLCVCLKQIHDAVCTVLNPWWWTERPSETCRVLSQNQINLKDWCIQLVLL